MKYFLNIFFLIILNLFCSEVVSQKITIVDSTSGRPIRAVLVFDSEKINRTISNRNGTVYLNSFKDSDSIIFAHIVYQRKALTYKSLKDGDKIILSPKALGLNEVVLSVSRNIQNVATLSRKVSVINRSSFNLDLPRNTAEMLYHGGGIHVQKSQSGGGSPLIRGFEANRVLLVIDGVRMNNAIYRSGHVHNAISIDANSLERTEVIFGPSSVAYGSDALGGVIHFYTKTPRLDKDEFFDYTKSISYNFKDQSKVNNYSLELSKKNWASYTSYTKSDFGDVHMGKVRNHGYNDWGLVNYYSENINGKFFENQSLNNNPNLQRNTAYKQKDFIQKFNFKIFKTARLILNFQFSESSNINRFDKLSEKNEDGTLKFAEWYYGPQKRSFISSKLTFQGKKLFDRADIIFAFQKIDESRNKRKFGSNLLNIQDENLNVFSINSDFFKRIDRQKSIAYGFELANNQLNSNGFESMINSDYLNSSLSRYPNDGSSYRSLAGYFNYKKFINAKTNYDIGLRISNISIKANWDYNFFDSDYDDKYDTLFFQQFDGLEMTNSSVTGSLGIVHRMNDFNKLSLNVSSGFRSPNIDDIGKIRENSGILNVPNTELKPEYVYTLDFGWSKYNKNFRTNFNIYYTILNGTIGRDYYMGDNNRILYDEELVQTMANFNLGNSNIYGGNFDFKTRVLDNILINGSITYTKGSNLKDMLPMPSIPPLFGNIKFKIINEKSQYQLSYRFSSSKDPSTYSIGGEDGLDETPMIIDSNGNIQYLGMPSWGVFQLSSLFKTNLLKRPIDFKIILDNIFDIHYREFASGISSPGRSLNLVAIFN